MSAAAPLQNAAVKLQQSGPLRHGAMLLQRRCACGSPTGSLTGECAECKSKKGLQAKLTIGASNDPLEEEADRVADQVLAARLNSEVSGAPPRIQRYTGQSTGQSDTAPSSVDRVLASPGRPLEPTLREDMERRFGHDFSRVRVHSGADAEQSAREVNANAYTVGHNIVFGVDGCAPDTHRGRRLIAHELTHTIQQSTAQDLDMNLRQPRVSQAGDRMVQRDGDFNVPTLDQMCNAAVQAARQTGNWRDAAEKLNGFNREDILNRLAQLTSEEVGHLHQGALDNPRVGLDSQVAQMTKPGTPRASTLPASASTAPRVAPGAAASAAKVKGADESGLVGELKVGDTIIASGTLPLAAADGVLTGGQDTARGVLTLNGAVLFGGATVVVNQGGAISRAINTAKAVTDVASKNAEAIRIARELQYALVKSARLPLANPPPIVWVMRGGVVTIGIAVGIGIALSPLVIAYAAGVMERLREFGGTLPPGGAPTPQEQGDAGTQEGAVPDQKPDTDKEPGEASGRKNPRRGSSKAPVANVDPWNESAKSGRTCEQEYPDMPRCDSPRTSYADSKSALDASIASLEPGRQKLPFASSGKQGSVKLPGAFHETWWSADRRTKITIGSWETCCIEIDVDGVSIPIVRPKRQYYEHNVALYIDKSP